MTDLEIENALRDRRDEALVWLMDHYGALVYRVCFGVLGIPEDAEEVAEDVFVSLWRKRNYRADRGKIGTFLCLRARSLSIDRLRSKLRLPTEELPDTLCAEDALAGVEDEEVLLFVGDILSGLPHPEQEILRLRFLLELPARLIAKRLELPTEEVYAVVRKGKNLLKKRLSELKGE